MTSKSRDLFLHFLLISIIFKLTFLSIHSTARAEETVTGTVLPKWELGVGFISLHLPDYPGAEQSHNRIIPAPFFVYRGDVLRADRGGSVRTKFFNSENLEADMSFGAGFPVSGGENDARYAMNELDWIGEFGPQLKYTFFKHPMVRFRFDLPVRYVFSTDGSDFDFRGYVFSPGIVIQHRALFDPSSFFSFRIAGTWATEDNLDYFYQVDSQYVRADRPLYDAKGGYEGTNLRLSLNKSFGHDKWLFLGFSKSYYAQAENRSSSLLRDVETEAYFLGAAWSLVHSDENGAVDSEDNN